LAAPSLRNARAKRGLPGLNSTLQALHSDWQTAPDQARSRARKQGMQLDGERVTVMLIMHNEAAAAAAVDSIPTLGGEVTAHYKIWLDAIVPIAALEQLAQLPGVSLVQEPIRVQPLREAQESTASYAPTGLFQTQGVAASNADTWHAFGVLGRGVKVAVMDQFQGYTTAQSLGELPPAIATYRTIETNGPHGTAVAEIIYDMAPGVALTFSSPRSAVEMASHIVSLAQAGNRIISSSIGFYNAEPGDGTGPVADAVTTAHNRYGTLYVQAAGNQANYHWDGTFRDDDRDGVHEFAAGNEINRLGMVPAGRPLLFQLRWNSWPVSNQDYDLYLLLWNGSTWQVVAGSENVQNGSQPPTEGIALQAPVSGEYALAIVKYAGTGSQVLDLMGHNAPSLQHNVRDRSLIDAATSPYAFSVAAVDAETFTLENYSSWGPTHGPGGALSGGAAKPHLAGFANVDTWAYGDQGFSGTSSATPHVAGAAALVWQAFPDFTPDQVVAFLQGRAIDQGTVGYDYRYGVGRLHLGNPPGHTLTVTVTGNGTVTSSPAGIHCPGDCREDYAPATQVTLSPTGATGWTFAGWSGPADCSDGRVTLSANLTCTATFTATVSGADLALTLGAAPDPVEVGSDLTYTLTIHNRGPASAAAVQLTHTLPNGATLVSASSGCTPAGGTVTCALNTLASAASVSRTVVVRPTAAGSLSSTARVQSSTSDANSANNSATTTTRVGSAGNGQQVDQNTPVAIRDVSTVETAIPVSGITAALTRVRVSLHLTHTYTSDLDIFLVGPDGTTVELSSDNGGSADNYGSACSPQNSRTTFDDAAATAITAGTAPFVGTFRPEQSLAAFVGKSGSAVNGTWTLRISDDLGGDVGVLRCMSLFLETTSATAGTDLLLQVSDTPDPVAVGTNVTYRLTVRNQGPALATAVRIVDTLPTRATLVSASPGCTLTAAGDKVVCRLGRLASGATATRTIVLRPTVAGTLLNRVRVLSTTADPNPINNRRTARTAITAQ
jgi:uncharacterized repeat protein (TIGR01451 family)